MRTHCRLLLILALAAFCAPVAAAAAELRVAATIFPLYDLLRQIGGERVEPFSIVPPGASPHTFAPTPQLLARIESADAVFAVGLGLDVWIERALEGGRNGGPMLLGDRLRQQGLLDTHGDVHGHEGHGEVNPHIWLDPELLPALVRMIADELMRIDPQGAVQYQANAATLSASLEDLAHRAAERCAPFRGRAIVVVHGAYSYLCEFLGVEMLVITLSPGAEPSARAMARLVNRARQSGVGAVFREPQLSPRAAQALAAELGVPLMVLDPLGEPNTPGRDTLQGLLNFNVEQILTSMERGAR
ncbi:MAG: metal ABC transporter substrate-binding protein [Candidatus Alcyoniella australis]|nr:metal ABC transporter substrate-binding protein [Candidatus Alcyoniella australis]